jgi:hypothetical protein
MVVLSGHDKSRSICSHKSRVNSSGPHTPSPACTGPQQSQAGLHWVVPEGPDFGTGRCLTLQGETSLHGPASCSHGPLPTLSLMVRIPLCHIPPAALHPWAHNCVPQSIFPISSLMSHDSPVRSFSPSSCAEPLSPPPPGLS